MIYQYDATGVLDYIFLSANFEVDAQKLRYLPRAPRWYPKQ